ncbi:response regulator transcription factor [Oceanobacillus neutriphilus]|uniref:Transcriptional regulatory protein DegU n=1 Tax=Oceanobacillus neutriphilus TaxID=531815 RepID=A0ABQ2NUH5_9BACI|nr:response regulator transcription factor [Oceanobacillus neutriphilus]GGP10905.1 transcriptional regulatory protein DegU [Oceanobacillus neutriphilus]
MDSSIILSFKNKLFRDGIKRILECEPEFRVISASDQIEEIKQYLYLKNNIVLMELINPELNHLNKIKEITNRFSIAKVIVLAAEFDNYQVDYALKHGVQGYLLGEVSKESLIDSVKTVSRGNTYFDPKIAYDILRNYRRVDNDDRILSVGRNVEYRKPLHLFTVRECEVLQLLAEGANNRKMANTLGISDKTVKNHVSSILSKMGVSGRTQAVLAAIKSGWVVIH